MLLIEFFEFTYVPRRLRGRSQNTMRLYRFTIKAFQKTLCRQPMLVDLTNENVSRHLQRVVDDGLSKATANKDRTQLLALWRYATKLGLLTTWPDVLPEIEPVRVPQAWMADDVAQLFAYVDRLEGLIGTCDKSLWWRTLLMTCLDTGERIGALLDANWSWLHRGWLLVPAESRKGGRRDRHYLLSPGTIQQLIKLKSQSRHSQNIWYWPWCRMYIWRKFGDILDAAGLPHGRRDKFHRLRRTCASVIHAAGLDATEALDHTHRRTTQAYLDPRFRREDQPSKIIAEWLKNPPKQRKNNGKTG